MSTARLFPDMAAAPTPTERRTAKRSNLAAQTSMFDADHLTDSPAPWTACPVCAGWHDGEPCPYGEAPELFDNDTATGPRTRCDRTYSNEHPNPYKRRTDDACITCGVPRWQHRYATAAECGADNVTSDAAASRRFVAVGHTGCQDCPGDLTDADHWTNVDIAGKLVPWTAPDMFTAAHLAALPTADRYAD